MALDFDEPDLGQKGGNQDFDDISSDIGSSFSVVSSEDDCDDADYTTMARFVPTLLLERLRKVGEATMARSSSLVMDSEPDATDGANLPKVHELDAAVMVVDVSGFSSMCERFAQGQVPEDDGKQRKPGIHSLRNSWGGKKMPRTDAHQAEMITRLYRLPNDDETKGFGAERVREALDAALGTLISTVERHGGDVLRIAGDALIVLFHDGGVNISLQEFAELCAACSRCGWDCATSAGVGGGKNRKRGGDGTDNGMKGLKVHAGIGCGRVRCFHVGSDQRGWQLVVSGEVFATQVANALDASRAGEVVVSEKVWQYLAGHGWGASIVRDDRGSPASGLRLLKWTPDVWNSVEMTTLEETEIDSSADVEHDSVPGRGTTAAPAAPFFGSAGALSSSSAQSFAGIRSVFGQTGAGAVAAGNGLPDPSHHARKMSLGAAGALCLGARWCPSRRRLGLLEEVETGVLTMLSKDVRRALKGYCPQPIREGLVAERIGLLAWIQRVAVLFVGLRFEGVEPSGGSGQSQSANQRVGKWGEEESKAQLLPPPSVEETETAASGAQLSVLQSSFSLMQSVVASHGGIIKELSVDDKGTVLVVGFGLYPQAGLLPAARATLCAMECTDRLRDKGLARCHAGIATGPVFCGSLGSHHRREFTMVSETVNLAQRIMSARKNRRLLSKTHAARVQQVLNKIEGNVHRNPRRGGDHGNAKGGASKASPATSMQPSRPLVATGTRAIADPKRPVSEGGRKSPLSWKTISAAASWEKGDFSTKGAPTMEIPHAIPPRIPHHHQPTKRGDPPAATSSSPPIGLRKKIAEAIGALSSFDASTRAAASVSALAAAAPVPTPAATAVTPSMVSDSWEEKGFNRWVVLEHETLKEARKTEQLAFLELEAVKVKGKTSKVALFAPGLSYMVKAALRDSDVPLPLQSTGPVSFPTGIIFGGVGNRSSGEDARSSGPSANGEEANGRVSNGSSMSRSNSVEVAKRYLLDIPKKGKLFAAEGDLRRPKKANTEMSSPSDDFDDSDDSNQDETSSEPQLTSTSFSMSPSPTPDVAAKEMDSWRGGPGFRAPGKFGRASRDVGGGSGGDVLSRDAFETLLPCIFHADSVHDEVSHILWARTGGRVSYLSELCRSLIGVAMTGTEWDVSVGDVGEDGMWRLRLNEFAHVLKLASRVPHSVEGELHMRLDKLPYTARQVVLQAICVTVVAGVGKVDLLLHLLANVVPFKEYWEAVVSQQTSLEQAARHRGRNHRRRGLNRRATSTSPVPSKRRSPATVSANADGGAVGDNGVDDAMSNGGVEPIPVVVITGQLAGDDHGLRRRAGSEVLRSIDSIPIVGRSRSGTEGSAGSLGLTLSPRTDGDTSIEGAGRKALLSCLRMLEEGGFLTVCDGGKEFICEDVMLIDQVYASTPFKVRKALHKEAAEWIAARHRKSFSDRAEVMPILISHLTQAHEEGRAQAMLAVLKVLGGRFMDRWVLRHVRQIVGIRENRNPTAMEHLAMFVLPALPSLRGLSKAIRGAEIAGVVVTVALRLRSFRFKNMDNVTSPRHRRSISSFGVASKRSNKHSGYEEQIKRAQSAGIKRHTRSLTGAAAAAPSSSALRATMPRSAYTSDRVKASMTE